MSELRVGIIGCGAVTVRSHLPVLTGMDGLRVVALADPQLERTQAVAARFGVPTVCADYRELLDGVDALVLALPHHLHAPVGAEVLRAGKHVLMEKPLANAPAECDQLIEAAAQGGVTLAVAQVRRYMTAYRAAREWLATELLGELIELTAEEGGVYNWPVASDFFFRPEHSGGGVLMDTGAHVLDALLWWLGDLQLSDYSDDNAGGVEADCTAQLRTAGGAAGRVTLSRVRALSNVCTLRGTRADLTVNLLTNQATLMPKGATAALGGAFAGSSQTTLDLFRAQAAQWLQLMRGEPAEIATAAEARRTVELIAACYAARKPAAQPWQSIDATTLGVTAHG
jgi:predicted dehydrogenase